MSEGHNEGLNEARGSDRTSHRQKDTVMYSNQDNLESKQGKEDSKNN